MEYFTDFYPPSFGNVLLYSIFGLISSNLIKNVLRIPLHEYGMDFFSMFQCKNVEEKLVRYNI